MKDIGLVFDGGGGKGAYQIGAWHAIRELDIEEKICAVSGTSVGALNAALFVQQDFQRAKSIWLNLSPDQILSTSKLRQLMSPDLIRSYDKMLESHDMNDDGFFKDVLIDYKYSGKPAARNHMLSRLFWILLGLPKTTIPIFLLHNPLPILVAIMHQAFMDSIISQDGLRKMIAEAVDGAKVSESAIPCFVTCCKLPAFKKEYFPLSTQTAASIQNILLASAAIPLACPNVKIGKVHYCDGGTPLLGDNSPVFPLCNAGVCNRIIVVHLSSPPKDFSPAPRSLEAYPGIKIVDVYPSQDLGSIDSGLLDFTPEGARWRMQLGYKDTRDKLVACF